MLLELIGKIFFPHRPDWERQRRAKIMTGVVIASIVFGLMLVGLLKLMNARR